MIRHDSHIGVVRAEKYFSQIFADLFAWSGLSDDRIKAYYGGLSHDTLKLWRKGNVFRDYSFAVKMAKLFAPAGKERALLLLLFGIAEERTADQLFNALCTHSSLLKPGDIMRIARLSRGQTMREYWHAVALFDPALQGINEDWGKKMIMDLESGLHLRDAVAVARAVSNNVDLSHPRDRADFVYMLMGTYTPGYDRAVLPSINSDDPDSRKEGLRQLRKAYRLGLKDVALRLHISRNVYAAFEARGGQYRRGVIDLERLADIFAVPDKDRALFMNIYGDHVQPAYIIEHIERNGRKNWFARIALAPLTIIHELGNAAQALLTHRWRDIKKIDLLAGIVYKEQAPPCVGGIVANILVGAACLFLPSIFFMIFGVTHFIFAVHEIVANLYHFTMSWDLFTELEPLEDEDVPVRARALEDFNRDVATWYIGWKPFIFSLRDDLQAVEAFVDAHIFTPERRSSIRWVLKEIWDNIEQMVNPPHDFLACPKVDGSIMWRKGGEQGREYIEILMADNGPGFENIREAVTTSYTGKCLCGRRGEGLPGSARRVWDDRGSLVISSRGKTFHVGAMPVHDAIVAYPQLTTVQIFIPLQMPLQREQGLFQSLKEGDPGKIFFSAVFLFFMAGLAYIFCAGTGLAVLATVLPLGFWDISSIPDAATNRLRLEKLSPYAGITAENIEQRLFKEKSLLAHERDELGRFKKILAPSNSMAVNEPFDSISRVPHLLAALKYDRDFPGVCYESTWTIVNILRRNGFKGEFLTRRNNKGSLENYAFVELLGRRFILSLTQGCYLKDRKTDLGLVMMPLEYVVEHENIFPWLTQGELIFRYSFGLDGIITAYDLNYPERGVSVLEQGVRIRSIERDESVFEVRIRYEDGTLRIIREIDPRQPRDKDRDRQIMPRERSEVQPIRQITIARWKPRPPQKPFSFLRVFIPYFRLPSGVLPQRHSPAAPLFYSKRIPLTRVIRTGRAPLRMPMAVARTPVSSNGVFLQRGVPLFVEKIRPFVFRNNKFETAMPYHAPMVYQSKFIEHLYFTPKPFLYPPLIEHRVWFFFKAFPGRIKPEGLAGSVPRPQLPDKAIPHARSLKPEIHADVAVYAPIILQKMQKMFEDIKPFALKKKPLNVRWFLMFVDRERVVYKAWRVFGFNKLLNRFASDRIFKMWRLPVRVSYA